MIRVTLPANLRQLARCGEEISVDLPRPVTVAALLDEIERQYPMLKGTIRDYGTLTRRPFLRFFACSEDMSLEPTDTTLPPEVLDGIEPFMIVGAIAGG